MNLLKLWSACCATQNCESGWRATESSGFMSGFLQQSWRRTTKKFMASSWPEILERWAQFPWWTRELEVVEIRQNQKTRGVHASPLFSVIIPMRNEEENIARCLTSLQHLQISAEEFEVIVVDNGSSDRSVEVARQFQRFINREILERPGIYISGARNAGAAVARGSYLAFLDADCEAKPEWLSQAARMISRGSPGVFGSFYLIPDGSSWVARNWYGDRERKEGGAVSDLPGGDLFVSRELFCRLQGFDESIQTNEDFEFCQRARADGMSICSLPELSVIHWGTPQSVAGFFRRHRWHGMHVLRVFLRNLPALYNF